MKILLLADQAEPTLWEHLDRRKLEGVELVLACGDLPASYLSLPHLLSPPRPSSISAATTTTNTPKTRRRAAQHRGIRS